MFGFKGSGSCVKYYVLQGVWKEGSGKEEF
jgi:hypothetical protein